MLQSPVRSKPEDEKKGNFTFSMGKDLYKRLQHLAKEDGRSVSSMVERLLREKLGMTSQNTPDPEGKE